MPKFTTQEQLRNAAKSVSIQRLGYSMLLETAAARLDAYEKIVDFEASQDPRQLNLWHGRISEERHEA